MGFTGPSNVSSPIWMREGLSFASRRCGLFRRPRSFRVRNERRCRYRHARAWVVGLSAFVRACACGWSWRRSSVGPSIARASEDAGRGDGFARAGGCPIPWAQDHPVEPSAPDRYADMPWSDGRWGACRSVRVSRYRYPAKLMGPTRRGNRRTPAIPTVGAGRSSRASAWPWEWTSPYRVHGSCRWTSGRSVVRGRRPAGRHEHVARAYVGMASQVFGRTRPTVDAGHGRSA